jgi:hypothetical protein
LDTVRGKLTDVDREAKKAGKSLAGIGSGGGGGGIRNTTRGLDAFGGAAAGATATIGGFRVAIATLIPLTIGFGGAAVSAASSLGPLIGLAAAGGNAFASLAQGLGVFKLATMGVADALKEQVDKQSKAASAAISTAGQQRAAARSIQSAQDGLRDATRSASDAVIEQAKAAAAIAPAFTAARVRVNDLRQAVVDAGLSLRGAKLAAVDARQALADLLNGPDPRKLADAHRAVTDAVRGEDTAVQALTDAHKALDELLKPADALSLADATDAVADAVRNEERARLALNKQIVETRFILQGGPGVTDDAQAQARLDLADAENAVGDATRQTEHAKQGLAKLEGPDQRAVEAARKKVSDAEDGVKQAAQDTLNARRDLADREKPATSQELAKARLDVAQAENAVGDAERERLRSTRELADAEKLGINRAPEVVAARDALTKANRDVADSNRAVIRAEQALGDAQLSAKEAMASAGIAATNLNEKFNKLPPAAKAFVLALKDMKPRLDELRQTAAAGFFPGATEGLQAAAKNFGAVNKVVGETATVLGEAARKSGELVGSPAFGKDLETIGGRNAKVLDTLGEALRHIVSALRHVAIAAGPLTQWLADLANKWALNAAESAKAGRETGKLAAFFERTREVTERLLSIIGHLASGLLGVGRAGTETGDSIWKSIDRAAARFDEWANSVRGQKDLQNFFREAKELAAALLPVLTGIAGGLAFVVLKAIPLADILEAIGPFAAEATVSLVAFKVATIAWSATAAAAAFATGGWATAFWALNAALIANPIGAVVAGIALLVTGIVIAVRHSETFRAALDTAFHAVGAAFNFLLNAAKATFNWLRDNWTLLFGILTNPVKSAAATLTSLWDGIRSGAASAWGSIRSAAASAWGAISDAILSPVRGARDAMVDVIGGIANRLSAGWDLISKGAEKFAESLKDAVLDGVRGGLNVLIGFLNDIIGVINELPFVDIEKIGKIAAPKAADTAGPGKKPGGFAQGGAFERTGGIIDQPMVLFGEEAPLHREWVIPENPAYRDRARMLLMQAWKSIGFASGGVYSKSELAALWRRQNGGLGDANLMAAIALAESGGDPRAHNPSGASGLWQILGKPFPGDSFDPATNARMAGAKLASQGLGAWEAYTNGAYRRFLNSDGGGGLLGKITGAIGDLLSKGAGFLLDKLPGISDLPGWLHGIGGHLLESVGAWIKNKVSDAIGLGGGDGASGGGVTAAIQGAMAMARDMGLQITSTTGGQHAANSWHYKGRAADVAGSPAQMAAFYKAALGRYDGKLLELFYDPIGAIKNGQSIPAIGGHSDHVHIALAKGGIIGPDAPPFGGSFAMGGIVPGPAGTPRLIEAHGGEAVMPEGEMRALVGELRALNASPTIDVIRALVGIVNTQQGRSARHRSLTAGFGGFPATP